MSFLEVFAVADDELVEREFIARLREKVREKFTPAFVGKGVIDLGDGPYIGEVADKPCACCHRTPDQVEVKYRCSRTSYEWDGSGENPNACIPLCEPCAEEYKEQMDSQWSDYYSGLL